MHKSNNDMRTRKALLNLRHSLLLTASTALLLTAATALLNACGTDDSLAAVPVTPDADDLTGQPIHFGALTLTDADIQAGTRAAKDLTTDGTTMTVIMTVEGSPSLRKMADYKYTGGSWQAINASGNVSAGDGLRWQNSTTKHSFTAYSPRLTAKEKENAMPPIITLPDEYKADNIASYDYLMTRNATEVMPSKSAAIPLGFIHLLARIEVTAGSDKVTVIGAKESNAAGSTNRKNIKLWNNNKVHTGYLLPGETFGKEAEELGVNVAGFCYSPFPSVTTVSGAITKFTVK